MNIYKVPMILWANSNGSHAVVFNRLIDDPYELLNSNDVSLANERLEMKGQGWLKLGTAVVEITITDKNERVKEAMEALEREKNKLREELSYKMQQLDDQLTSLLALPNLTEK